MVIENDTVSSARSNASTTKVNGQCAEGRIGPLCNKCGPFGSYLEMAHLILQAEPIVNHAKS